MLAVSQRAYWRAVKSGGELHFHVAMKRRMLRTATTEALDNLGTAGRIVGIGALLSAVPSRRGMQKAQ